MPIIVDEVYYNGFQQKIERLGLDVRYNEIKKTFSFSLLLCEQRQINGTKPIRRAFDEGFSRLLGWRKVTSGGIDWTAASANGSSIGVEVQVSGRSDMLAVDVLHLRGDLENGTIDAGVIIVPSDLLSRYLTDRTPNLATAKRHIGDQFRNLPLCLLAFEHDGPGDPIPKMVTNLGKRR
jgi:hypothetical protein